jgi:TolA-binding protein
VHFLLRRTALLAAVCVLLGAATQGRAEPNDAKARYLSGQSHYNLNEFPEALQDFKEAYRLHPDPAFLFNIAQCERQLGELEEAIKFYRSYLRNKPDAKNRREVERKIEELRVVVEGKKKATLGAPQSVIPPSTVEPSAPAAPSAPSEPRAPAPAPAPAPPLPAAPPEQQAQPAASVPPAPRPTSTATAVVAANAAPGADLSARPAPPEAASATPFYRRWWFWTGAGAAVVGAAVLTAVALSGGGSSPPGSVLGTQRVF